MMSTINDLNTTNTLEDDDKLLVWKRQSGATRAITATNAAQYFSDEISGNFQPFNAFLANIASQAPNTQPGRYFEITGVDTVDLITGANLLANIGGLAADPTLIAIGGLTVGAGDYIEATGVDTFRARKLQAATYAELTAIPAGSRFDGMVVYVASRASEGDGGDGYWRFDAASSATADGGTILAPDAGTGRWSRVFTGAVSPKWFGALGDDTNNDTAAIQAAIATGLPVVFPPGIYLVDVDTLTSTAARQAIFGLVPINPAGTGGARLRTTGTTGDILRIRGQGSIVKDLAFELSGTFVNLVAIKGAKLTNTDDLDLTVANCRFINCTTWIHAIGRGLFAFDNVAAGGTGIEECIIREWPASGVVNASGNPASPDPDEMSATDLQLLPYGFRKDQIMRNYPHSSSRFVVVKGPYRKYYRGMISGNMCDNGARLFQGAFSDLILSDNHVKHAPASVIYIDDDSEGLVMTGNNLSGQPGSLANSPASILWTDGASLKNSTITGNRFAHADGDLLLFDGNLENVTISGNTLHDWRMAASGTRGSIRTGASRTWRNVVVGNNTFMPGTDSQEVIAFGSGQVLEDTKISGNTWDKSAQPRFFSGTYTDDGTNDVEGRGSGDWKVLAQSGVAVSHTGNTNETVLATVAMPGGTLGANGVLRITTLWTVTNSADNKTFRVRLGGVSGAQVLSVGVTTVATAIIQRTVWNRNSEASQVSWAAGTANSFLIAGAANFTSMVNTANAQDIVISGQLATGTDTVTLEGYLIEYQYRP